MILPFIAVIICAEIVVNTKVSELKSKLKQIIKWFNFKTIDFKKSYFKYRKIWLFII